MLPYFVVQRPTCAGCYTTRKPHRRQHHPELRSPPSMFFLLLPELMNTLFCIPGFVGGVCSSGVHGTYWPLHTFSPVRSAEGFSSYFCSDDMLTMVQSEERWAFSPAEIAHLLLIWGHISDVDGTISHRQLVKLVRSLLPPLGMGPDATNAAVVQAVENMGVIPVFQRRCGLVRRRTPVAWNRILPMIRIRPPNCRYTFEHTVFALVANLAEVPLPKSEATEAARRKVSEHFTKVRHLNTAPKTHGTLQGGGAYSGVVEVGEHARKPRRPVACRCTTGWKYSVKTSSQLSWCCEAFGHLYGAGALACYHVRTCPQHHWHGWMTRGPLCSSLGVASRSSFMMGLILCLPIHVNIYRSTAARCSSGTKFRFLIPEILGRTVARKQNSESYISLSSWSFGT